MKFLEILSVVTKLIPMLIEAIKAIEEAIPGQGQGEKKLAAVRSILEAATNFVDEQLDDVWPVLERVIAALVELFNKTGVFNK